jgi:hypothetical protein
MTTDTVHPETLLTFHELDALRWIADQHPREAALSVQPWRDSADVGWLMVRVRQATTSPYGAWIGVEYRVSPLGHVYLNDEVVHQGGGGAGAARIA